jgi:hypothetical protein
MIAPAPIDPFLSELKHAQLAGQRVLAAQRRPSTAAGHRGRGEPHPRAGQAPTRGPALDGSSGRTGDRAE